MDGTISLHSTRRLDKAAKTLVTSVRRSIQTAVEINAASNDRATALLAVSGKCAAMYAGLHSSSKRQPTAVWHLMGILSPLSETLNNVKLVVRNSKEWVTLIDQQEAFELMGLHLEECQRVLRSIATEKNAESCWPEYSTNTILEKRTAAFTAKCDRQRGLASTEQWQPATDTMKSFKGSPPCKRSGSRSVCSTAALSDGGATDASSSPLLSQSSSSSSSSASLLSLSSFTFPGSENITVRPSSLLRWAKESMSAETSPPLPSPPSPPSPTPTPTPTPTPSVRAAEGTGLRRQKRHVPLKISGKVSGKVSVSPGAAFVPYRSPARLAGPRGTSLRGSGAIATRKRRW